MGDDRKEYVRLYDVCNQANRDRLVWFEHRDGSPPPRTAVAAPCETCYDESSEDRCPKGNALYNRARGSRDVLFGVLPNETMNIVREFMVPLDEPDEDYRFRHVYGKQLPKKHWRPAQPLANLRKLDKKSGDA